MNNLKDYRKRKGLTQEELSRETGVISTTICKLERGIYPMTMRYAKMFAPALDCKPEELLGDDRVRTITVVEQDGYHPTFEEAFRKFLVSYYREYGKSRSGKASSAFPDDRNRALMAFLIETLDTDTQSLASMTYEMIGRNREPSEEELRRLRILGGKKPGNSEAGNYESLKNAVKDTKED